MAKNESSFLKFEKLIWKASIMGLHCPTNSWQRTANTVFLNYTVLYLKLYWVPCKSLRNISIDNNNFTITYCVILARMLNLSGPQFFMSKDGDNNSTYFMGLLQGVNEKNNAKFLELYLAHDKSLIYVSYSGGHFLTDFKILKDTWCSIQISGAVNKSICKNMTRDKRRPEAVPEA